MCVASVRSAAAMPSIYERPRPRGPNRRITETRPWLAAPIDSASSAVPSGELSSTTSTCNPSMAISAATSGRRLSRSLYVGTSMRGRITNDRLLGPRRSVEAERGDLLRDQANEKHDDREQNQDDGAVW